MIYAVGADENTPVKKIPNKAGKGYTLMQDPLDIKPGVNVNGGGKTTPTSKAPSSGGGGGGTAVAPQTESFDMSAYLAALQAQKQARADDAYRRNMDRISSAYGSAAGNLRSNYDSTVGRLNAARDSSLNDVNTDAEKSLREAYINNMLTKKNLNQRLSAMGYNGGATESTMASLENQYGNSRTGINETRNKNINDLNMRYGDNLASALQSYNDALSRLDMEKMQLEMQAEQARQAAEESYSSSFAGLLGGDSSYISALQSALANQANYQYDPTKATNNFVAGNAQQAASAADTANMAKYYAQAQLEATNGKNVNQIKNDLFNAVSRGDLSIDSLYQILQKLGAA